MPQKILTDEEQREARRLAWEMKMVIDRNFLKPRKPEVAEKIRAIRKRLHALGFYVTIEYEIVDLKNPTLDSVVELWLAKDLN